ncbi:MAG: hypothetical protein HY869_05495 [Chloroflexi bacterium]|nr:hypothetical protein [Chloroflexota bacterium]
MTTFLLELLIILASIGSFSILVGGSRQVVRAVLSGKHFNKLYLQYLKATTKHEFEAASTAKNPDRAWNSIFYEKVYELGISGVLYATREKNLDYIKEEALSKPYVSRKLAGELIKVLPKQNGNLSFQAKLACYICELLNLTSDRNGSGTQPIKSIHGIAIDHLTTAISAWLAGIVYLLLSIYILDDLHPVWVAISSFLLFVLMIVPLLNLIGTFLAKLTVAGTIGSVIILFLGVFATIVHGGTSLPLEIDLNSYQNPGAKLSIRSPEWLSVNNVECKGKKISVIVSGKLVTPIRFYVNDDRFYFVNKDCGEIIPQLEVSQPETQAYEFYIAPRDISPFSSSTVDVKVIPSYVSQLGEVEFNSSAKLKIKLEHWLWGLLSNIYLGMGTVGGTILLYLINNFLNKRKP